MDSLIKQDCLMFDRSQTNLNDYFLKNNQTQQTQHDVNTNVRRQSEAELNKDKAVDDVPVDTDDNNKNKLKLQENNLTAIVDTDDKNRTAGFEDQRTNDINIHNNFVDQQVNTSRELKPTGTNYFTNLNTTIREPTNTITMRDYEELTLEERLVYDNRSFGKFMWDSMVRSNQLISLFVKNSVIDPILIRIVKLILGFSLMFGFNAILFTESYIEARAFGSYTFSFMAALGPEAAKTLISLIGSSIIYNAVSFIAFLPQSLKIEWSNSLKTKDVFNVEKAR
jgi:hypothetical protein